METIIGQDGAAPTDLIKDATIETFEQDVVVASASVPVIVDFWAEWCGPCKQLTPMLEQAVIAAGGKVRLVKIDIDKNQMLASQLRIQSVPTVYAFIQGRPVDGFQGALPQSEITAFIDRLTEAANAAGAGGGADPIEGVLEAAAAALEAGDAATAAQAYAQVAQADPTNLAAIAGLAKCHLAFQDIEKAKQVLAMAPEDQREDEIFAAINAAIALAESNPGGGDIAALRAAAESAPEDLDARFTLAGAMLAAGEMEPAIDELLTIIARDREWNEEAARKKLLTIFEALGGAHPATVRARRRLSSILFS